MSNKDIELEGFKKSLNEYTINYWNEKQNKNDKIDLKKLSELANNELRNLENDAAKDYLKIENETNIILKEIDTSDEILGDLEHLLNSFKNNLSEIKNDMNFLQEKSMKMNISLNNRKQISNEFSEFIDNVMIEPKLIDKILKDDINEQYVETIEILCLKMNHIKKYDLLDNLSIKEIEPELTKLKLKACERIKLFLIENINFLKKPKTNIQILQQNTLIKYKSFLFFLKEHNQAIFLEISNNYGNIMKKIYNNNFKSYINELNKLLEEIITKNDLFLSDNQLIYKNNHVFSHENRVKNLDTINNNYAVNHIDFKNNKKYPLEILFISLNKLLTETVIQEFTFIQNFFSLSQKQTSSLFLMIFKSSIMLVLDKIKYWIYYCNDFYTLIIILITNKNCKNYFQENKFNILDYYFEQIDILISPKLNQWIDSQISNIININIKMLKQIEGILENNIIYKRLGLIINGYYILVEKYDNNIALKNKGDQLIKNILEIIKNLSKERVEGKDSIIYKINKYEYIFEKIKILNNLKEEKKYTLENDIINLNDDLVNILIDKYFNYLFDFLKNKKDNLNLKLIEKVNKEFCEGWKYSITNIKNELQTEFENNNGLNKFMNRIMLKIIDLYQEFYSIVKSNYSSFTSNMLPIHKLTLDIKTIIN